MSNTKAIAMAGRRRPHHRHMLMGLVAALFMLVSLASTLARVLPSDIQALPYVPDLVALTPWFLISSGVALLLSLAAQHWGMALLSVVCLCVQVYWQYPFFQGSESLPKAALSAMDEKRVNHNDAYARVMSLNVYKGQGDANEVVKLVRDQGVEVLALQETTDSFVARLDKAGIGQYLPYAQVSSSDGHYGNGLWSATALGHPSDDDVHGVSSFMPGGTVSFNNGRVSLRFVSVHTTSPSPGNWKLWKRSLDDLAKMTSKTDNRYVFMGDFNATYDHTPFRNMLGNRFADAARQSGHGFTFSWPTNRPCVPAFTSIDHIVLDKRIKAGQLTKVKITGSDHKALLATIAVQ